MLFLLEGGGIHILGVLNDLTLASAKFDLALAISASCESIVSAFEHE